MEKWRSGAVDKLRDLECGGQGLAGRVCDHLGLFCSLLPVHAFFILAPGLLVV